MRIGLETIPEETMEQILAAATHDAKNYAALVAAGIDGFTARLGEQGHVSRLLRPRSAAALGLTCTAASAGLDRRGEQLT